MENRSPIFPMPDPHYSDYGFDASIDFFQALQQARKQGRRETKPLDGFRFKLKKPISKENSHGGGAKMRKWWRRALVFWRQIRPTLAAPPSSAAGQPVYTSDDGSAAWSWRARRRGGFKMPYVCIRELAAVDSPVAAPPLYLVS